MTFIQILNIQAFYLLFIITVIIYLLIKIINYLYDKYYIQPISFKLNNTKFKHKIESNQLLISLTRNKFYYSIFVVFKMFAIIIGITYIFKGSVIVTLFNISIAPIFIYFFFSFICFLIYNIAYTIIN